MDSPLQPYTPEQWANLNRQADVIYDDFTAKVAAGRKLPLDKVAAAARGRVWTGADAKAQGLVDELGGFWTAAGQAARPGQGSARTKWSFRVYPRRTGSWRGLCAPVGRAGRQPGPDGPDRIAPEPSRPPGPAGRHFRACRPAVRAAAAAQGDPSCRDRDKLAGHGLMQGNCLFRGSLNYNFGVRGHEAGSGHHNCDYGAPRFRDSRTVIKAVGDAVISPDRKNRAAIDELSFEGALKELEAIVSRLEQGEVDLEDSIALYERGQALKAHCEKKLKSAEGRLEKIVMGAGGPEVGEEHGDRMSLLCCAQ